MHSLLRALLVTIVINVTVVTAHSAFADKFNEAIWVERLITETKLMLADKEVPHIDTVMHLSNVLLILGRYGKDEQALELEKDSRVYDPDEADEIMLMHLAEGLSEGDYVERAIEIAEQIETENSRDYTFKFIATIQTWQGDYQTAESIIPHIKSVSLRKSAVIDICRAYVEASRIDDAKQLAGDPADAEIMAKIDEFIQLKKPPIDDPNYVESMVRIRSTILSNKWDVLTEYLRHYYSAEYALHKKNNSDFAKHSSELIAILDRNPDRLWERLDVAELNCRGGNMEAARSLYSYVLTQFCNDTEQHGLSSCVKTMLTSFRRKPPVESIPLCFSAQELEAMTNTYINNMATWDMAAALLALAIKVDNAAWAEAIYQDHPSPQFKAKVAKYVLFKA